MEINKKLSILHTMWMMTLYYNEGNKIMFDPLDYLLDHLEESIATNDYKEYKYI